MGALRLSRELLDLRRRLKWCGWSPLRSRVTSDDLDLDPGAAREGGNLNGGTGREVLLEKLLVDCVHFGEFRKVGHENGGFNHVFTGQCLVLENGRDILKDLTRLFSNAALDQFALFGEGYLAGTKQEVAHSYSMGVRSDRFGRVGGLNNVRTHKAAGVRMVA